ncbi:hypothetical protein NMG60_11016957 [Bertholletia excelsa]
MAADLRADKVSLGLLLGTTVLVFLIDTTVISTFETKTDTSNLVISIFIAITIIILLLAIFPVSGAHFNPIISSSTALIGLLPFPHAIVYILAQCLGDALGALALSDVVNSTIQQTFSLGGCTLSVIAPGCNGPVTMAIAVGQALWLEIICTFIFLLSSIWIAFDDRQAKKLGLMVVFTIVGTVIRLLAFISTTVTITKGYVGPGMNLARSLGLAIVIGGHLWHWHWVLWVGLEIASVAFYLYTKLIPSQHFMPRVPIMISRRF